MLRKLLTSSSTRGGTPVPAGRPREALCAGRPSDLLRPQTATWLRKRGAAPSPTA